MHSESPADQQWALPGISSDTNRTPCCFPYESGPISHKRLYSPTNNLGKVSYFGIVHTKKFVKSCKI